MAKNRTLVGILCALALIGLSGWAQAGMVQMIGGGTPAAGGTCDSCAGALILTSHFENNDNIETGTPCGCSTNADKTWALSSAAYSSVQKSDGTYSLKVSGGTQSATIATDVDKAAGTVSFDIYIDTTFVTWADILRFQVDASNYIGVYTAETNRILIDYVYGGTSKTAKIATDALTVNTWHTITVKWSVAGVSGHYLGIQINSDAYVYRDAAPSELTGTPSNLVIGYSSLTPSTFYIDNLKVYNSWQ